MLIIMILLFVIVVETILLFLVNQNGLKQLQEKRVRINKFIAYFKLYDDWMYVLEKKRKISTYLNDKNINTVAIYGLGKIAFHLIDELINEGEVEIKYLIDQKVIGTSYNIPIKKMSDNFDNVDAIIVTPIFDLEKIENQLQTKIGGTIISVEDVILELKITNEEYEN